MQFWPRIEEDNSTHGELHLAGKFTCPDQPFVDLNQLTRVLGEHEQVDSVTLDKYRLDCIATMKGTSTLILSRNGTFSIHCVDTPETAHSVMLDVCSIARHLWG